jgi:DNA-binding PadR family transcriptional regulator
MKRDPSELLPLSPAMFHVLVALADGDTHGYAIMKEVEQLTSGAVRLSTGTLYGIIKRLLADGLIRESVAPALARRLVRRSSSGAGSGLAAKAAGDERRRSYVLTPFGKDVARAEATRLEHTIAIARRKPLFRRS